MCLINITLIICCKRSSRSREFWTVMYARSETLESWNPEIMESCFLHLEPRTAQSPSSPSQSPKIDKVRSL